MRAATSAASASRLRLPAPFKQAATHRQPPQQDTPRPSARPSAPISGRLRGGAWHPTLAAGLHPPSNDQVHRWYSRVFTFLRPLLSLGASSRLLIPDDDGIRMSSAATQAQGRSLSLLARCSASDARPPSAHKQLPTDGLEGTQADSSALAPPAMLGHALPALLFAVLLL